MAGSLLDLVSNLKAKPVRYDYSEEAAKFAIIGPVLDRLGWDLTDSQEVVPEYPVKTGKVDFCLRLTGTAKVFIEAKKPSEDLDTHQEQLLNYAFAEGVDIAVLTNGLLWWLYLPMASGSWDQRKFFAISMLQQDAAVVVEHFTTYLSRSAVASGAALRAANDALDGAKSKTTIGNSLPIAWERLLSEPHELLVDLIAEAVEGQCGHRPDTETVATFLAEKISVSPPTAAPVTSREASSAQSTRASVAAGIGYTGQLPTAFTLFGKKHSVPTRQWKRLLLDVAAILYQQHQSEFDLVLSLHGPKRAYFARSPDPLRTPIQIAGSPYFAETNLSANDIVKRCHQLLERFNHPVTELTIDCQ